MSFPAFFAQVRCIEIYDPLAEMLGAAEGGRIAYGYADAVKLAGHSCPTVAGAYLMTAKALAHLYENGVAERGAIRVAMREDAGSGVAGVVANVIGLITGAAGEGGFKGLGGRFARRNLLFFGAPITGDVRFTRMETGASVDLSYHAQHVPPSPAMGEVFARIQNGEAEPADFITFGQLWQERVARILLEHFDDPAVVSVSEVSIKADSHP